MQEEEAVSLRHNRIPAILAHGWRYAFHPTERLAADVGVAPRTIRRLLEGKIKYRRQKLLEDVAMALTIDLRLPFPLPLREIFSPDGTYPTPSTCALCDCDGCLPEDAYTAGGRLRRDWLSTKRSDWCHYPKLTQSATPTEESR